MFDINLSHVKLKEGNPAMCQPQQSKQEGVGLLCLESSLSKNFQSYGTQKNLIAISRNKEHKCYCGSVADWKIIDGKEPLTANVIARNGKVKSLNKWFLYAALHTIIVLFYQK
ncbi:hypothetical protein J6590_101930 [Homalodisca vitripennis]|nr:hypothetical protein J6590_101930 [Homalodisca vitripennis]